ncbi:GYDIA family GHMP kinase [Blattabacterium cuenoti]|uniref:GYDIA family GHMP kinase n=1 Tax=Blattabacterium cuenoti TaxID=1653831 RepID=UPI00163C45BF|nr:GYDIA family GHMP kinase [Blattabacterium cuenoti]
MHQHRHRRNFYSHGKLLLTGEYFILYGAYGLALPTIKGQSLTIFENNLSPVLHWKSYDEINDKPWFEGIFKLPSLDICYDTERNTAVKLRNLLLISQKIKKNFLHNSLGIYVKTQLEFPRNWGLGSSSTLINNIAKWAKIDPYMLLGTNFPGSGYDIACVSISKPIVYKLWNQKPHIIPIKFNPSFKDQLFFLHLNKKQNTCDEIRNFRSNIYNVSNISNKNIESISSITKRILFCKTLKEFEELLLKHEKILSKILKLPTIKEIYFPDYLGIVKSLGAWGGDFVLISSRKGMKDYFSNKGFDTLISFDEMIFRT